MFEHSKLCPSEQVSSALSRTVALQRRPISESPQHRIAVIASISRETSNDLFRYCDFLTSEFSGLSYDAVQILFADNTLNNAHRSELGRMSDAMGHERIDFAHLHAPKPGKIHGLNACLKLADASFILSVDPNKQPRKGTLVGICNELENSDFDLISARLAGGVNQHWNAGAAYGAKQVHFAQYFPPVLNEDEFMLRLTLARGGKFKVSELLYDDLKGKCLSRDEHVRRSVRAQVGSAQINNLTVDDGERQYRLFDHNVVIPSCLDQVSYGARGSVYKPFQSMVTDGTGALRSLASHLRHGASDSRIYQEYMQKLIGDPALCAW